MKVEKWFLMLLNKEYLHYKQLKEQVVQICYPQNVSLKILSPKQMLQRLPTTLAKYKQVLHLKTYQMKPINSYILSTKQKTLLKKYITI